MNDKVLKVGVGTLEDSDYLYQDYNLEVSLPFMECKAAVSALL